jgi:hypothetical protein
MGNSSDTKARDARTRVAWPRSPSCGVAGWRMADDRRIRSLMSDCPRSFELRPPHSRHGCPSAALDATEVSNKRSRQSCLIVVADLAATRDEAPASSRASVEASDQGEEHAASGDRADDARCAAHTIPGRTVWSRRHTCQGAEHLPRRLIAAVCASDTLTAWEHRRSCSSARTFRPVSDVVAAISCTIVR